MTERTLPTYHSPCDFYGTDLVRPLGYFEGTTSTADTKMVHLIYTSAATSGCARALYSYLTLSGAGEEGEAVRGRTAVTAAAGGGVHGGHFGLEIGSGGSITGLGVGCRATFMCPDGTASGTIAGGMSELWAEGTSSDFTGATHSIHRFVMDGNATGYATATNVFEFVNLSSTQYASNTDTPDHALRVLINGNVRYIMVSEAQS
jgi:hypothetical protein